MSVEDLSETLLQIKVCASFVGPQHGFGPLLFVWCPSSGF